MKVAHPVMKMAACAAVGATALAACSESSNPNNAPTKGAFGNVPPAVSGPHHSGTITWAEAPGTAPTWIYPITPSANSSVYTAYDFQYEMWRPLYWTISGVEPVANPSMSMAADPTWSNGNKRVTVKLKNWKWSDGQPVTSKDLLFFLDEVKVAVTKSLGGNAANWAQYTPGVGIPDAISSATTPDAHTLVINLKAAVNPTWFALDELPLIQPMPAHAWAKASANGAILDFTNLSDAKKINAFLSAQAKDTKSYATNSLWQIVDGPYKLTSFNPISGAYALAPNTNYSGPHVTPMSKLSVIPFISDTAEFNAVKSGSVDVGYVPLNDVPQISAVKSNYNVYGYPSPGFNYMTYNFK